MIQLDSPANQLVNLCFIASGCATNGRVNFFPEVCKVHPWQISRRAQRQSNWFIFPCFFWEKRNGEVSEALWIFRWILPIWADCAMHHFPVLHDGADSVRDDCGFSLCIKGVWCEGHSPEPGGRAAGAHLVWGIGSGGEKSHTPWSKKWFSEIYLWTMRAFFPVENPVKKRWKKGEKAGGSAWQCRKACYTVLTP